MWFVDKELGIGRCRRHAPTMSGYPVVMVDDWCGDHKLSERVVAMERQEAREKYYKMLEALGSKNRDVNKAEAES